MMNVTSEYIEWSFRFLSLALSLYELEVVKRKARSNCADAAADRRMEVESKLIACLVLVQMVKAIMFGIWQSLIDEVGQ